MSPPAPEPKTRLRFEDFELDPESGDLRRGGETVKLAPQPFRILALLAQRAGEPVSRDEIRRQVWGEETYVDFERGLNFCISQIRAALGDDAQSPRFVQTLPRRGYRFIAPVERVPKAAIPQLVEEAVEAPPAPLPLPQVPRLGSQPSRLLAWAVAAVLGLLLVIAFVAWRHRDGGTEPRLMIAVLPFEDLSAGPPEEYWSDGLTGELIAQLGRVRPERLGVIARTSVMAYKGARRDVEELGDELGVDYLLEGSVRRAGDRVRITAQLVHADDRTQLWSETYDRDRRDVLDVQAEVGAEVVRALQLELLPESARQPRTPPDPRAWDDYLRGRYLAHRGDHESLRRSLDPYERAVRREPAFAEAHAAMADALHRLVMSGGLSPRQGYPRAEAAARRAVALDSGLAEAHAVLGAILFWYRWDWPAAERELRRALELNPSLPEARHDYGFFLIARGRADEGLDQVDRARDLDPLSARANVDVGWAAIGARRYDEAVARSQRTLELVPGFGEAQFCMEQAYTLQGLHREAWRLASTRWARADATPGERAAIERLGLETREPEEALRAFYLWNLQRLEAAAAQGSQVNSASVASLWAFVGNEDRAFDWLEKAVEERSPTLTLLAVHPSWDGLRADPRFAELLKKVGPG
ncbi:MAG TPA: winged helix-turn-helix domain-containing protein [Thermoanaerobaculia bacterium]|nr:winged helix-turn-helix domain-containing protein [Thermoanaerobaculia bacterium]